MSRAAAAAQFAVDDEAFCVRARAQAQLSWDKRGKLVAASKAAWDSGDKAGAKRLSEQAKAEAALADKLSLRAAQEIFALKNGPARGLHPLEVDLHGLEVVEAVGFTKSRLAADMAAGRPHLVLIYGAGHHSAAGQQKIKPAVMALLQVRGLSVIEDWNGNTGTSGAPNPGCCTVQYSAAAPTTPERQPGCSFGNFRCSLQGEHCNDSRLEVVVVASAAAAAAAAAASAGTAFRAAAVALPRVARRPASQPAPRGGDVHLAPIRLRDPPALAVRPLALGARPFPSPRPPTLRLARPLRELCPEVDEHLFRVHLKPEPFDISDADEVGQRSTPGRQRRRGPLASPRAPSGSLPSRPYRLVIIADQLNRVVPVPSHRRPSRRAPLGRRSRSRRSSAAAAASAFPAAVIRA